MEISVKTFKENQSRTSSLILTLVELSKSYCFSVQCTILLATTMPLHQKTWLHRVHLIVRKRYKAWNKCGYKHIMDQILKNLMTGTSITEGLFEKITIRMFILSSDSFILWFGTPMKLAFKSSPNLVILFLKLKHLEFLKSHKVKLQITYG